MSKPYNIIPNILGSQHTEKFVKTTRGYRPEVERYAMEQLLSGLTTKEALYCCLYYGTGLKEEWQQVQGNVQLVYQPSSTTRVERTRKNATATMQSHAPQVHRLLHSMRAALSSQNSPLFAPYLSMVHGTSYATTAWTESLKHQKAPMQFTITETPLREDQSLVEYLRSQGIVYVRQLTTPELLCSLLYKRGRKKIKDMSSVLSAMNVIGIPLRQIPFRLLLNSSNSKQHNQISTLFKRITPSVRKSGVINFERALDYYKRSHVHKEFKRKLPEVLPPISDSLVLRSEKYRSSLRRIAGSKIDPVDFPSVETMADIVCNMLSSLTREQAQALNVYYNLGFKEVIDPRENSPFALFEVDPLTMGQIDFDIKTAAKICMQNATRTWLTEMCESAIQKIRGKSHHPLRVNFLRMCRGHPLVEAYRPACFSVPFGHRALASISALRDRADILNTLEEDDRFLIVDVAKLSLDKLLATTNFGLRKAATLLDTLGSVGVPEEEIVFAAQLRDLDVTPSLPCAPSGSRKGRKRQEKKSGTT